MSPLLTKERLLRLTTKFAAQRVAVAGLVFLSSLIAARLLGPNIYGGLAMFQFLAKILLVGNVGCVSGYIFRTYDRGGEGLEDRYVSLYLLHLGVIALGLLAVAPWFGPAYVYGVIGFGLLIPLYVVEPVLRVRRNFSASLWPDLVLGLTLLVALAGFAVTGRLETLSLDQLLATVLLMMPGGYFLLLGARVFPRPSDWIRHVRDYRFYGSLIRHGFPLYLATIGFILLQSIDRFFLDRFHGDSFFGVYMLAFQLANGGMLILNAQNFVSAINIGEVLHDPVQLRQLYGKNLRSAAILASLGAGTAVGMAWLIERFLLPGYIGLTGVTGAMCVGLAVYFVSGNVSGIAFFKMRQTPLTAGIFTVAILAAIVNLVVWRFSLSPFWLVVSTSLLLALYGLATIFVCRRAVLIDPAIPESSHVRLF